MSYYSISIKDIRNKVARKKISKLICEPTIKLEDFSNVKEITNEFNETLIRVDGNIPSGLSIENGQRFLFISYDQSRYAHGFHKYPAKFFPELPRWLISRYSKQNDIILDPFAGSGTTNVEALLSKRNSIGIDVDPFSRFLSKVKTTPLPIDELEEVVEIILNNIVKYKPTLLKIEDLPEFPYRDNWFNNDILLELAYIKKVINNINANKKIKDFCKIAFSSIIRSVSNADDNCTRTVVRKKLQKNIYPSMALTKFAERLLLNTMRMVEFVDYYPKGIAVDFPKNNDARDIKYDEKHFDLAITSPPYVNAVDYPRTHQLELYWLDFVKGSLSPLKEMHIGTEVVKIKQYKDLYSIGVSDADRKLAQIFEIDPRRAYIAYKYLSDMKQNLKETYRVLKKNGRYVVVVGNNTIRGILFENWKYLMSISQDIGFTIESYFGSEIIKHFIKVPREQRITTDWVIVLKK